MATITLTYDCAVGYDYGTGMYEAASVSTDVARMTKADTASATITPA